jgi:hypothetical protein
LAAARPSTTDWASAPGWPISALATVPAVAKLTPLKAGQAVPACVARVPGV